MHSVVPQYTQHQNNLTIRRRNSVTFATNQIAVDSELVKEKQEFVDIYMDGSLDIEPPKNCFHKSKKIKRCSLGISTSDLQELTGDNISGSKRSSLDMLFSFEERRQLPHEECCRSSSFRNSSSLAMNSYYNSRLKNLIGSIHPKNDISNTQLGEHCPEFDSPSCKIKSSSLISTEEEEVLHLCPVQSLLCSSKYQLYLRTLIDLMEKSEESRMKMKNIKRHYCQQNTKITEKSYVHTNIQYPSNKRRSLDSAFFVEEDSHTTPLLRRRSSIITQSFKLQFFPENE